MKANMKSTLKGSHVEDFYPKGWDLEKLSDCCKHYADEATERQSFWNNDFSVESLSDGPDAVFDWRVKVGLEIATQIKMAKDSGKKLALLLPGYPLGQYQWATFFLKDWEVKCDHVFSFSMNDWCDSEGNSSGMFEEALNEYFYEPLGEFTVPKSQRFAATKEELPKYDDIITKIKKEGGKLITIYGIGRDFNIGFWEPQWAADYNSLEEYKKATYRIAGKLHPLTQATFSLTTFRSNFTLSPAFGNTVGMGLVLKSDYLIGGCDRLYSLGGWMYHSWQGIAIWATLRYNPDMWVPSSFIPSLPGKFFYPYQLADVGYGEF